MKKKLALILALGLIPLLLLARPPASGAATFGFKFFGGLNSMKGGDINEGLKGFIDLYKAETALGGAAASGDYKAFHGGMDLGGDVILHLSPSLGIGLGVSSLKAQSKSAVTIAGPGVSETLTLNPQITAIPLRAGLHFSIPIQSFLGLSLNAGVEYCLAKVKYPVRYEFAGGWEQTETNVNSKGKIGFCAGIGLELKIHPNWFFILEGRGRYARLDGFEGRYSETSSSQAAAAWDGKLWYVKLNLGLLGQYPHLGFNPLPPPSDPAFQDARPARLDISGFSAVAGIIFRFS